MSASEGAWRRWLPDPLSRRPLIPLLLLATAVLLWNLGGYGLWESTEARYAEIAARMVRSGDWITPRLNGIAHFDKPPVAYWASAAGMALLGIDEAAARLPLVLASLAALALVHRLGVALFGGRAAAFAFLVLLSSPLWFALSRSLTTDLWLTLWVLVAVDAARVGSRPGAARGWRLLACAAVGAGFLTKGPVVFLWTALPALAWAAWTRSWRRLGRLADPLGIGAFLVVALPWYLLEASRHPGLLEFWLRGQVEGRVVEAYKGEREPWWHYLAALGWTTAAWIVPAIVGLLALARRRGRPGWRFLLVWVAVPLVAFSLFPTKRTNYLLPALPALALAAGSWWDRAQAGTASGGRAVPIALAALSVTLGVALTVAGLRVEDLPTPLPALGWLFGPVLALGGGAAWVAARRGRLDLAFAGLLIPLLGLHVGLVTALGRPAVESWSKISRPLVQRIAAHRLADEPIVNVHVWLRAIPFYLDERVVTVDDEGRLTLFEEDERWREYVFRGDTALHRMLGEPERRLFVARRTALDDIERAVGRSVTVLAGDRRHALFTNRPTAGETARDRLGDRPPHE
ncbi:MAG TPA: glycosyltransferase family 39 protein [Gemmatimonadota bacterium]|nr:glycosyltransferase family 39 protein [Gemmatimonadota bacterium]